jgi:LTXXQ motif family protein
MTKQTSMLLLAAALAAGMPVAAEAQHPHGGGRPAAAPAARPAAPQVAPRMSAPAPRMSAPAAPRMATPHMAPRMATPRAAAPRMTAPHASPRMATPRMHSPNVSSQRMAVPHRQPSASVNRTVQRQQFRQERELRHQRALQQDRVRASGRGQSDVKAQSNTQVQSNVKAQSNVQAQSNPQSQQLNTRQQIREQMRAERTLRRQEAGELRRLPPSQRAQRREEIRNAREQRALNRQQLTQPNALREQSKAQSDLRDQSKQSWREKRLNGAQRVTQDAARQGRFAARFAQQQANGINARNRWNNLHVGNRWDKFAARHAWRRHHRAHFVAWFGPIFWPYAYSDIFDYTFWPSGYDDGYWAYAYDDFFDGLFWGEAGPPVEYAYAPSTGEPASRSRYAGTSRRTTGAGVREASVRELCRQPGSGITAWPFADIERRVGLDADQKQLLDQVRASSEEAAAGFKASCPPENAFPLTPPGRLDAMLARLQATLQAVQTVRPPLEKFYNSLSDEQKERFNQLGPKDTAANAEASVASQNDDSCRQPKPGLANLPIEKIEDVVNPTGEQAAQLSLLQDATNNAVGILQAACPNETPMTPPGRLDAMEKRLQAMVDAAKTVKPALESFYASLTSEQKARFNRIGRSLADASGQSTN